MYLEFDKFVNECLLAVRMLCCRQFNTAEGDFANDNAFVCDCQLNWLREYLETFLPYYISVFCADPEPYRGLKIQDVSMACGMFVLNILVMWYSKPHQAFLAKFTKVCKALRYRMS